ncbi:MAG TPA: hypothetical protein VMW89_13610 [Desulfatiglandales bacterium]|nr:hypothetical protein [Desulfatiglandales bacterium]
MKKSVYLIVVFTFVLSTVLIVAVPAGAGQGPQIRLTDSQARADQPDVAIDSNGNAHIVYCDDYDTSSREIWYTMLDNNGNTLIDDTRLTDDDGYDSTRPGIVIDSSNKVHITFRDQRWDSGSYQEVTYTKLDPSLDDQNGGAADAATITAVGITALTPDDGYISRHPAIASSGNGQQIHITWEESEDPDGPNIHYLILDTNGNTLVSDTALTTNETAEPTNLWTMPYLDVDADGKAHIVWSDYRDGENEVYYTSFERPPVPVVPVVSSNSSNRVCLIATAADGSPIPQETTALILLLSFALIGLVGLKNKFNKIKRL